MDQKLATEGKKRFWHDDRRLVCSLLVVYGVCILGLIAATLMGLDRRNRRLSAEATSTAVAVATHQANATLTASARTTEQAGYELVDRFDTNRNNWRRGPEDNEYWSGQISVEKGVYRWEVSETKETFISWADFSTNDRIRDFDVYVDTKVVEGGHGEVCSGFLFRVSPNGWDQGGYYFGLCNNSQVSISYHKEERGWEHIRALTYPLRSSDWNRLEIRARGKDFTFLINGEQIYSMNDNRQHFGGLALFVELNELVPAEVLFDNFGLQIP